MRKMKYYLAAGMCCMGLATGMLTGCSNQTPAETTVQTEAVTEPETETSATSDETEPETEKEQTEEDFAVAPDSIPVFGPLLSVDGNSITIDNQSETSSLGEMVIHISDEETKVLDAVNGFPVQLSDLKEGEMISAYIGPAMTMSLPPQTSGIVVFCQIPEESEGFEVPEYVKVKSMEKQDDESFVLTSVDGSVYQVPADCQIIPYLTRNLVRLEDITEDSTCIIWSEGEDNQAVKIVLFAE